MDPPASATSEAKPLVIRARRPSFEQARDGRHLLIWPELGQWLIVDGELRDLISLLGEGHTLPEAVAAQAQQWGKEPAAVADEVAGIIAELSRRRILEDGPLPTRARERIAISSVTLNLTNRCNLRCRFCYNLDHRTDELAAEVIMDALAAGRSVLAPGATLMILGGEPLLDVPRLMAVLDRAPQLFAAPCMISTNGTLVTDSVARALAGRHVDVQVSIDSALAERHDQLRGKGTYAKAVAAVRRLVSAGVHTTISAVLGLDALDNIEDTLDLARELGAAEARFIPLRGDLGEAGFSRPDLAHAFARLLEVMQRRPALRSLLGRDFFSILRAVCRRSYGRSNCGIGCKVIFIDADGSVYPCPNHLHHSYLCGHLDREGLAEIVNRSAVMVTVRERYHVERFPLCRDCLFRYWCAGDCRGEVLAVHGDLLGPAPYCADLQHLLVEMFWLLASDDPWLARG